MDIKLKNIKSKYSNYIVYGLILILSSSIFLSLTDIKRNYRSISFKQMYISGELNDEIENYISKVMDYTLFYKSEEYVKDKNNITKNDIDICKAEIRNKIDSEISDEENSLYGSESFNKLSYEDQQKKLLEVKNKIEEKYNYTDEQLEQYVIERKLNSYKTLFNEINSYKNLNFSVYDETNKKWISNEQKNLNSLKSHSNFFEEVNIAPNGNIAKRAWVAGGEISEKDYYSNRYYYGDSRLPINTTIKEKYGINDYSINNNQSLSIYVWIPQQMQNGDLIYTLYQNFIENNDRFIITWIVLGISSLILLVISRKLRKNNGINTEVNKVVGIIKNYPIEYKVVGILVSCIIYELSIRKRYYSNYIAKLSVGNIIGTAVLFGVLYVLARDLYLHYKEGTLLENNISIKVWDYIKEIMKKGSIFKTILLMTLMYIAIVLILLFIGMILESFPIFLISGIIVTIIFIVIIVKRLVYLDRIMAGAKDAAEGKLTYKIEENGQGKFTDLAHNINNIKEGLRESIQNEIKSEKMRTELITNVSHDLKTPLTSIINYIELLKREEIEPDTARDYLNVLDNKAQRLKILIEDLFEASKAASGTMELNIEKLEITQLIKQVLGENDEKIKNQGLDLRINTPEEKVFIKGDGKRLYRVFENLVSNIVKYSMEKTRVYIDVIKRDGSVEIVMKNIASYELNFDVNEITERFKRADEARSSEGSGLGLAIAKSIVELHEGKLDIQIDGDLFKSIITLTHL